MNREEMKNEGYFVVKRILRHKYVAGYRFETQWEGYTLREATWEPFHAFSLG